MPQVLRRCNDQRGRAIGFFDPETGKLTDAWQTHTSVGWLNLPSEMPDHASQLYARNVQSLLELMVGEGGALELDFDDEIIAGACITRDGEIVHEGAKQAAGAPA